MQKPFAHLYQAACKSKGISLLYLCNWRISQFPSSLSSDFALRSANSDGYPDELRSVSAYMRDFSDSADFSLFEYVRFGSSTAVSMVHQLCPTFSLKVALQVVVHVTRKWHLEASSRLALTGVHSISSADLISQQWLDYRYEN